MPIDRAKLAPIIATASEYATAAKQVWDTVSAPFTAPGRRSREESDRKWREYTDEVRRASAPFAHFDAGEIDKAVTIDMPVNVQFGYPVTPRVKFAATMRGATGAELQALPEAAKAKLPEEALRQGSVGTPFYGLVPQVEILQELYPYRARGMSSNIGEFSRFERGDPSVGDSIRQLVSMLTSGSIEFDVPDVPHSARPAMTQAIDDCRRAADVLNREWLCNPSIDPNDVMRRQLRGMLINGFALDEYGVNPNAEAGRRIDFCEKREQSSVILWVTDRIGRLQGFSQVDPNGMPHAPVVDIRKCVYSALDAEGLNWEGIAMIRSAWTFHKLGTEFIKSSIMHRQRFGPGIPVLRRTSYDRENADLVSEFRRAVSLFYNSAKGFMDVPAGADFDIMQVNAEEGLVEVLELCARMKRTALGSTLFDLGQTKGAYNLGDIQSQLLLKTLSSTARQAERGWDGMIRLFCDATTPRPLMLYPRMRLRGYMTRSPQETILLYTGYSEVAPLLSPEDRASLREQLDMPAETVAEAAQDAAPAPVATTQPANPAPAAAVFRAAVPKSIRRVKPPVVTVTCRDGVYSTFRELTAPESSIGLNAIETYRARAESALRTAIERVQREQRNAYSTTLRRIRSGEIGINEIDATGHAEHWVPIYAEAMGPAIDELIRDASTDMLEEISAQVGSDWSVVGQTSPHATLEQQARAVTQRLAVRLARTMEDRLKSTALQAANGGTIGQETQRVPDAGGFIGALAIAQVVSTITNGARERVAAEQGPRIGRAFYSAVMDQLTCASCASLDGTSYRFPSAAYERAKPPNPRCHGVYTAKGLANPCRCLMVYIFDPAGSKPSDEGDDTATEPGEGVIVTGRAAAGTLLGEPAKRAVLICGPMGSGKSASAARLRADGYAVFDGDDYLTPDGSHSRDVESLRVDVADAIANGDPRIAVTLVFGTPKSRAPWIEMFRANGYDVGAIVYSQRDEAEHARRMALRPEWRRFPWSAVEAVQAGIDADPPSEAEGLAGVVYVDTTPANDDPAPLDASPDPV